MRRTDVGSDFDTLCPSLGRLVLNSSCLETELRSLLCWLAQSDEVSIVFEGQSVDWMIGQAKAMLGELKRTSKYDLYDGGRIDEALTRANSLNRLRNFYVHGQWSTQSIDEELADRQRRLTGSTTFYVTRSKLRKASEEREVPVSDVDLLADQVLDLASELDTVVAQAFKVQLALIDHQLLPEHRSMTPGEMGTDIGVVLDALRRTHENGDAS